MNRYEVWGGILIVAAIVALALQHYHWRRRRLTTAQYIAGTIARAAFLFLGIVYATELIDRYPRLPLAGLFVVGIGIFLSLAVNIVIRHRRASRPDDDRVP